MGKPAIARPPPTRTVQRDAVGTTAVLVAYQWPVQSSMFLSARPPGIIDCQGAKDILLRVARCHDEVEVTFDLLLARDRPTWLSRTLGNVLEARGIPDPDEAAARVVARAQRDAQLVEGANAA